MKDHGMKTFIMGAGPLADSDPALLYPRWQAWCGQHGVDPGLYDQFVGRLQRTLTKLTRKRAGRTGWSVQTR